VPIEGLPDLLALNMSEYSASQEVMRHKQRPGESVYDYNKRLQLLITKRYDPPLSVQRALQRGVTQIRGGQDEHIDDYLKPFELAYRTAWPNENLDGIHAMDRLTDTLDPSAQRAALQWTHTPESKKAEMYNDPTFWSQKYITSWTELCHQVRAHYLSRNPRGREEDAQAAWDAYHQRTRPDSSTSLRLLTQLDGDYQGRHRTLPEDKNKLRVTPSSLTDTPAPKADKERMWRDFQRGQNGAVKMEDVPARQSARHYAAASGSSASRSTT
jgi:hypothetical protein